MEIMILQGSMESQEYVKLEGTGAYFQVWGALQAPCQVGIIYFL